MTTEIKMMMLAVKEKDKKYWSNKNVENNQMKTLKWNKKLLDALSRVEMTK